MFDPNSGFVYLLSAIVIAFVFASAFFFLVRAWRQARRLGIGTGTLKKVMASSAVFTIVPSISILMGVVALSKALGIAIPWLRLSVIGSLSYEATAAAAAASAFGYDLSMPIDDPRIYTAIVWAMCAGTLPAFVIVPLFCRKIERGMMKIENKDRRWGEILITSLFIGMLSVFVGVQFAGVTQGLTGWVPVFVMISSIVIMVLCERLSKLPSWKWVESYALPLSMLGSMALSIPIANAVRAIAG